MTTISIPRIEYQNILKTQSELGRKVAVIENIISDSLLDKVSPKYAKKLERISAKMDKGEGIRFSGTQEIKKYLRNL